MTARTGLEGHGGVICICRDTPGVGALTGGAWQESCDS